MRHYRCDRGWTKSLGSRQYPSIDRHRQASKLEVVKGVYQCTIVVIATETPPIRLDSSPLYSSQPTTTTTKHNQRLDHALDHPLYSTKTFSNHLLSALIIISLPSFLELQHCDSFSGHPARSASLPFGLSVSIHHVNPATASLFASAQSSGSQIWILLRSR